MNNNKIKKNNINTYSNYNINNFIKYFFKYHIWS